jgi:hypothetical protein
MKNVRVRPDQADLLKTSETIACGRYPTCLQFRRVDFDSRLIMPMRIGPSK